MRHKRMTLLTALIFLCSFFLLMTSCAKKQVRVSEAAKPSTEAMRPEGAPSKVEMGDTEASRRAEAERQARLRELEQAQTLAGQIKKFESEAIYFDFDKADLKPEAQVTLKAKAEWLRMNPAYSLRIEGHCDERGTNEYNLALGERRAYSAKKFLVALGISADRIRTISYGEERPADPRHNEDAWAKNRRDEFKLIK